MAERQQVAVPLDGTDFSRQILPYVRGLLDPERTEIILVRVTRDIDEGIDTEIARPEAGAPTDTERPFMPGGGHLEPFGPTPFTAEGDPQAVGYRGEPVYAEQIQDAHRNELIDAMADDARALEEAGFPVHVAIRFGEPAEQIVNFVLEQGVDLVAITTHRRSGLDALFAGSVAEEVVDGISAPVMLLRASEN